MKKIMIGAVVAMAAFVSQAAQVSWQMTATKADAGAGNGLQVYMILADSWQDNWASGTEISGASVKEATFSVGAKSANTPATAYMSESLKVGNTLDYYLVMVDTANNRYFASDKITSSASVADGVNDRDAGGALIQAGTPAVDKWAVGSDLKTPGNWTTFAAPEPTSGLLFLIGMAGLALRRRRA